MREPHLCVRLRQSDERLELPRESGDLSAAAAHLTHLDVRLDQLVAGLVSQLRVERLLRVRLKKEEIILEIS